MRFTRHWHMPSADTFSIKPFGEIVKKYIEKSKVSVDPFARNNRWATFTNDLNPDTLAEYHLDAKDFISKLSNDGVKADLLILDPPYSSRQISECYEIAGKRATMMDTQSSFWSGIKNACMNILTDESTVISFGWNTVGMGRGNDFEIVEIILVCHGGAHNDTICTIEKRNGQLRMDL